MDTVKFLNHHDENNQMLVALLEDGILTVVLANDALDDAALDDGLPAAAGDGYYSFAALSPEGLLAADDRAAGSVRGSGRLEDVIGLLERAPVGSAAEDDRRRRLIESWQRWPDLPQDARRHRAGLVRSAVEDLTRLSRWLGCGEPSAGRLELRTLLGAGPGPAGLVVADLSAEGHRSPAAATGAGLLLRLAAEEVWGSFEPPGNGLDDGPGDAADERTAPAIVCTHKPGAFQSLYWGLSGRELGPEAIDRLTAIGALDDSPAAAISSS